VTRVFGRAGASGLAAGAGEFAAIELDAGAEEGGPAGDFAI